MWPGAWGRKWGCKGVARGSQERRKRWVDPARSETPAGLRCVKCRTALPQNRAPAQGVDNALPHHRTLRSNRSSYDVLSGLRAEGGPLIVFVHGWPELSISWRHQLPCFAALGFRCIAPDMRGYGRSSVYPRHEDYALEHSTRDMLELLEALGRDKAVWVGHDWGSPVVWSIASHHPDALLGVANLCVPYIAARVRAGELHAAGRPRGLSRRRSSRPASGTTCCSTRRTSTRRRSAFEAHIRNTVKALFRKGNPAIAASRRARRRCGGTAAGSAAPAPRRTCRATPTCSPRQDLHAYAAALKRNGFFGPDSWYMNHERNIAYAADAQNGGRLDDAGAVPARRPTTRPARP